MAKKLKQTKLNDKLSLENIIVGDIIPDLHDVDVNITDDLIEQMKRFEKDSKKTAIWRGKITGSFLYFKWVEENPQEKKKSKKPKKTEESIEEVIDESLEQEMEAEVQSEEEMLLDAIEDYKVEFNIKKVNTNTKKFKQFFEEWKQAE